MTRISDFVVVRVLNANDPGSQLPTHLILILIIIPFHATLNLHISVL